jgi:uncharacterized protein YabE (DUF348 family)
VKLTCLDLDRFKYSSRIQIIMNSEILIYENKEGNISVDVRLEEETVWLTQDQLALFLGKAEVPLQNIF